MGLADVSTYLYGIWEILGFDLNKEIIKKVRKNRERKYVEVDGVHVKVEWYFTFD